MKISNTKLYIVAFGLVILLSVPAALVTAEDGGRDSQKAQQSGLNHSVDDHMDSQDEDSNEQDNEEHDIFSFLNADHIKAPKLALPEINENAIVTYADVVTIIKSYEQAIAALDASAGVNTQGAPLSPLEKALLDGLLAKHKRHLDHLDSRIAETSAQLKAFEDLLTPLGTQPITASFGIKGILVSELNNYRDILSDISEFDDLTTNILEQETD